MLKHTLKPSQWLAFIVIFITSLFSILGLFILLPAQSHTVSRSLQDPLKITQVISYSVFPPPNTHTVPISSNVGLIIHTPISQTLVNTHAFVIHSQFQGPVDGQFHMDYNGSGSLNINSLIFDPVRNFYPGELVQTTITTDLIHGGSALTPTVWQFRTAVAGGSGYFVDSKQRLGNIYSQMLATGDVDGDGDIDAFVVGNYGEGNTVWLNDGLGTLTDSGQNLGTAWSYDVALGDLDKDGDLDAFVANEDQANKVWLNNGAGIFSDSGQRLGLANSKAVALGDIDNDGDLDAFVGNAGVNKLWLNDGTGIFTDSRQSYDALGTLNVNLADVDGDNDLDAFIANSNPSQVSIWFNDGTGIFTDSTQRLGYSASSGLALGDLDNDSDLDIFVGNVVWFNNSTGIFTDSVQVATGFSNDSIALGDVDADGDLDAFIGTNKDLQPQSSNQIWLNDGTGIFTDSTQRLDRSRTVALADLDSDGDLDALMGNDHLYPNHSWLNDGGIQGGILGQFSKHSQVPLSYFSMAIALGDLDGDGDLDAFAANEILGQANQVWLNNGGIQGGILGQFSDSGQKLGDALSWEVALGDIDNDGDLDAFVANMYASDKIWLNNGLGQFSDSGQSFGEVNSFAVALGDIDGDGDLDAVLGNESEENNNIWLNDSTGIFTSTGQSLNYVGDPWWVDILLRDLDNDNDLDIFINGGGKQVWLNDGLGNFSTTWQNFTPFVGPVAMGDINADGSVDVIAPGINKLYLNNGDGTFSEQSVSFNHGTDSIALNDLDGDGDLDIFLVNQRSSLNDKGGHEIWLNDGLGNFSSMGQLVSPPVSNNIALGDLDNDGDLDAFIGGLANTIWLNQNTPPHFVYLPLIVGIGK